MLCFLPRGLFCLTLDNERQEILLHLQDLHQLSREYMIPSLTQRIENHIYLQSLSIQTLNHAVDIFNTLEVIDQSESFRIRDLDENCSRFLEENLTSLSDLYDIFSVITLSPKHTRRFKYTLLKNLLKRMKPRDDESKQAKEDVCQLVEDLFEDLEREDD